MWSGLGASRASASVITATRLPSEARSHCGTDENVSAYRVFSRKVFMCELLIHDYDWSAVVFVRRAERSAFEHRYAKCRKIVCRDRDVLLVSTGTLRSGRAPNDIERQIRARLVGSTMAAATEWTPGSSCI